MLIHLHLAALSGSLAVGLLAAEPPPPDEARLLALPDAGELRRWHDLLASRPHDAGTAGDRAVAMAVAAAFQEMGLEVDVQSFYPLLAEPVAAAVQIVRPDPIDLPITEREVEGDPYVGHDELRFGWNAYSGSGDVTAQVVYANYGRKEDFARLRELGVSCRDRIVIARYGGNYRGYKAHFAEAEGAVGLIIFTDPKDSGYGRGIPYPEGGYANETSIQRGSIKTLPYFGDPLTPFVEATEDAERLDPNEIALSRIPVQPIGWGAAQEILERMRGKSVPGDWQGGLPLRYRLEGGPELEVRLEVDQKRFVDESWNVVATLRGSEAPDQEVILGAHHDAWGFGAGDPTCGLITVMETARVLSEHSRRTGWKPRRSISFAAWGAEEFGIIGSVEWVEANLERLKRHAVAYVNLDMAAMGPRFRASGSPILQRAIYDAAARVELTPAAGAATSNVALDWLSRGVSDSDQGLPRFGDMGGGSDHVGFIALAGVPCASLGAGGSPGSSYHSNYDNLHWYRQVVGDDYQPAVLVTRVVAAVAQSLADDPVLPFDPVRIGVETRRHLSGLGDRGAAAGFLRKVDGRPVAAELARVDAAALRFEALAADTMERVHGREWSRVERLRLNEHLLRLERCWLYPDGMPNRPWFQNLYAATDEDSGYAAWMLPLLRHAVEHRDPVALAAAEAAYLEAFDAMERTLAEIDELVGR